MPQSAFYTIVRPRAVEVSMSGSCCDLIQLLLIILHQMLADFKLNRLGEFVPLFVFVLETACLSGANNLQDFFIESSH